MRVIGCQYYFFLFLFLCFVSVSVCCSIWVLCLKIKIYIHTYIIIIIRAALSVGIVTKVALLSLSCSRLYCGSDSLVPVCDTRTSCVVVCGQASNVRNPACWRRQQCTTWRDPRQRHQPCVCAYVSAYQTLTVHWVSAAIHQFLPRNAMLARHMLSSRVRVLSQVGVLLKRLNG